ncbi:MAG TPA: peptidylprolyl isomerase, partial [Steroidobacteraceae bacterium]|nr:peptidylprolyl isomerase [Steroidobacteraceae bacterium]
GRTEPQFEEELRRNLAVSQLRTGIAISGFVTPSEVARRLALEGEEREVDFAIVSAAVGEDAPAVTDEEVEAFYAANRERFFTPETVTVNYVDLTLEDVARDVDVSEDALRAYYDEVKDRFETPERRQARHILIESTGDDDTEALAKAEAIAEQARAGTDFAELAREHSQDPGSAEQGGDLGWATRGMFVGPFEEALFSMSPGEIAGPVKTQFGYHVIRLEEVDSGHLRSFDEVRAELEEEYRRDQATNLFYERAELLGDEAFTNLESLEPAAAALGLPVETVTLTRQGGEGIGSAPDFIEAAFSADGLERGLNSPLLTLSDERVAVLRATGHELPEQQPLADVRDQIVEQLRATKARERAAEKGEQTVAALQAGGDWQEVLAEYGLEPAGPRFIRRGAAEVPPAVAATAFAAPKPAPGSLRSYLGTELASGDYAVVLVSDVREGGSGPDAAAERIQLARQAARDAGFAEFAAYVSELERTADVKRSATVFE